MEPNFNPNFLQGKDALSEELLNKIKKDSFNCRKELIDVLECLPFWEKSDKLSFINTPPVITLIGIIKKYPLVCPPFEVLKSILIGKWPELFDCIKNIY